MVELLFETNDDGRRPKLDIRRTSGILEIPVAMPGRHQPAGKADVRRNGTEEWLEVTPRRFVTEKTRLANAPLARHAPE